MAVVVLVILVFTLLIVGCNDLFPGASAIAFLASLYPFALAINWAISL